MLYLGTTETFQEIVELAETSHQLLSGTTTLCSVIGGLSVLSILSNPSIHPQKICLFDMDPYQCVMAHVYLELIEQATSLSHFIQLLYGSRNADQMTLDNMVSQIRNLDGKVKPIFSTAAIHDFYYYIMLPRIMRGKYHEFPTELWPCWYESADKELVYQKIPNSYNDKGDTSMFIRGDPYNIKKGSTLYYRQAGWLMNNDKFITVKRKLNMARIYINRSDLNNIRDIYDSFSLKDSNNIVFFVSNADHSEKWTIARDKLKKKLYQEMKSAQRLIYISAGHHDILETR